jgi:hypothetical protein
MAHLRAGFDRHLKSESHGRAILSDAGFLA